MSTNNESDKSYKASEIEFFSEQYGEQQYNPVGFRLRLMRDVKLLLREFAGARPRRLLSVGCGQGEFELMIAPYVDEVVALDLSPEAIEIAQSNARKLGVGNVSYICQPFEELEWEGRFDVIVCVAFLHHVPVGDMGSFLMQCHGHLEEGGFLYSSDPNINGILRKIGRVVLGRNYDEYHTPDERELDTGELCDALQRAGFSSVSLRYTDFFLIPASYILARWPGIFMHAIAWVDRFLCSMPRLVASQASTFAAVSRK
ncbi:MAG: class I SAM-dependent methyltransferase [Halioglobus sp.]|nr:class I SAM-dependent methyltransferase [Halioglobus sp.]